MDISGYYDLATKRFTPSLETSASGSVPPFVAGEDVTVRVKFKQTRAGAVEEVSPEVVAMKAMIGQVDVRPISGKLILEVDGEEFTPAITYTYPEPADLDPALRFENVLKEALESISGITEVSVTKRFNSYVVIFEDDPTVFREINVVFNTLFPSAFFHIRGYIRSGQYEFEMRPVRSPVGYTNTFTTGAGLTPTFTTLREGGSEGTAKWSEVQALHIPPSFTGTFRIKRGQVRSEPLSRDSSLQEITDAVQPLADPGGAWNVTLPVDDTIYFYFLGDMTGINQDQMEVEIFQAPSPENIVSFTTKTRAMAEVMMEVDQAVLAMEVYALLKDLENPAIERWHCVLRQQVGVREAVDWDGLAVAPEIDWLQPPALIRNNVFSPGQVSNGQIHYSETLGDGMLQIFTITHGLATSFVDVIIIENQEPGLKMVEGVNYSWSRENGNQVKITWLTGTPAEDQYTVTVLGLAQTSFFDNHTHFISEIEGLQEWIDSVESRLAELGAATGGFITTETGMDEGESARWAFPNVWELYPSRVQPSRPGSGLLSDIDMNEEDESGSRIINRGRGLLAAVHDADVEALPLPLPNPSSAYLGRVFANYSGSDVSLPGAYGLRTQILKPLEYAACDGRLWYPVVPHNRYQGYAVDTDFATDPSVVHFTSEMAEQLETGTVVQFTTTGTLPTGLLAATDYTVYEPNFFARTCKLLDSDGDAVELASDGSGTHTIHVPESISYYPRHFERTLLTIHVNEKQFRPRKNLFLAISLEAAILKSVVDAQLSVFVELGEPRSVVGGGEGENLEEVVWRRLPALEQVIVLSPISSTHKFGIRLARRIIEGEDTISGWRMLYGAEESGIVPPRTSTFSLRVKLGKFDTSDNVTDPLGLLMLSGLNVTREGSAASNTYELGFAVIK